jgi:cobaltochelatase CobT
VGSGTLSTTSVRPSISRAHSGSGTSSMKRSTDCEPLAPVPCLKLSRRLLAVRSISFSRSRSMASPTVSFTPGPLGLPLQTTLAEDAAAARRAAPGSFARYLTAMAKTESPLEPFKRAIAHAARSLAEQPDLEVVFSGDGPSLEGHRAVLPHPSRDLPPAEAARIRGMADQMALRLAHHDAQAHAKLRPFNSAGAKLFEAVEQARIDAIGSNALGGVRANLGALLESELERKGLIRALDRTAVPLHEALALMVRERLTGDAPPDGAREVVDLVRGEIEGKAGKDLDRLAASIHDQDAFGRIARPSCRPRHGRRHARSADTARREDAADRGVRGGDEARSAEATAETPPPRRRRPGRPARTSRQMDDAGRGDRDEAPRWARAKPPPAPTSATPAGDPPTGLHHHHDEVVEGRGPLRPGGADRYAPISTSS